MIVHYSSKKVKRNNKNLNPEAYIDESTFPEKNHLYFEQMTRSYRIMVPEEVRSNDPSFPVQVTDILRDRWGNLMFNIWLPDSTLIFNASLNKPINWIPLMSQHWKNDSGSFNFDTFYRNRYLTAKVTPLKTTETQIESENILAKALRFELRRLDLFGSCIHFEKLEYLFDGEIRLHNIFIAKNASKEGIVPIFCQFGNKSVVMLMLDMVECVVKKLDF